MAGSEEPGVRVRVISLAGSPRRAAMARQLAAVPGLDWSFFDALRALPAGLSYKPAAALRTIRRELTGGEIGCFASHAALWRELVDGGDAAVVVFEDDVLIDPGFLAALPEVVAATAAHPFVRLHAKAPVAADVIGRVAGRHLVRYRGIAFGTQGYILRRAGAVRWLASITTVIRPVDDEIDRYWAHGVPSIGIHPSPLIELMGPSTIEGARRGLPPPPWSDFDWQRRRTVESLRRRLANLRAR